MRARRVLPRAGRGATEGDLSSSKPRPICSQVVKGTPPAWSLRLDMDGNSLSGLNVLIVDDDTDARELTCMILSSAGAFVDEAASGEEALEKLHADPDFHVVVSDIAMPHMDGI